jgi:CheY-like chemotaxis protein
LSVRSSRISKIFIGTRIEIKGPPLLILASAAQTIGMAMHELAANVGKYGALSGDHGRVEIAWTVGRNGADEDAFTMSWCERGGPPVTAPPRKGFGSTVINTLAEQSLDGKVDLEFKETGLSWRMRCPGAQVIDRATAVRPAERTASVRSPGISQRPRILVVEDEPLVALEIAQVLEDGEFDVLGPARLVAPALALIEEAGCDAAVLDINLGGETSEAVARKLLLNGTQFVTLSGYSRAQHPPIFNGAPALSKPLRPELLIAELHRCINGRASHSEQLSS